MSNTNSTFRLIIKKYAFIPVDGKMYRKTEILEEIIENPHVQTVDLTSEYSESFDSRCFNTPTYCNCEYHRRRHEYHQCATSPLSRRTPDSI